jgi:4-hydroxybenzoate polyprenyltransferase
VRSALDGFLASRRNRARAKLEKSEQSSSGLALPVNDEVYEFLLSQKSLGRPLILRCKNERTEEVVSLLGDRNIFDTIVCEGDSVDISTRQTDYDFLGGQSTPFEIWKQANARHLVTTSPKAAERLAGSGLSFSTQFTREGMDFQAVYKSIRAYQWLKNFLVFVPLITSQQFSDPQAVLFSLIMFVCFSMVASFGYIVNDILDLQSDRAHLIKKDRPFAKGTLSIGQGCVIGCTLLAIALAGCLFLPLTAGLVLAAYLALTLLYSLYLKTKLMLDIVALGGLFTLRVIGGGAAIQTELSFYLMFFSIFIFSSLGLVKRYAELRNLQDRNKQTARGRGYLVEDMLPILAIGITLGNLSVFVMGLYINSPLVNQYYTQPKLIWFLLPLLTYWLGRLWIITHRGVMNEDPLIFAAKDKTSLLILFIGLAILYLAA